jgi:hypothetical protein
MKDLLYVLGGFMWKVFVPSPIDFRSSCQKLVWHWTEGLIMCSVGSSSLEKLQSTQFHHFHILCDILRDFHCCATLHWGGAINRVVSNRNFTHKLCIYRMMKEKWESPMVELRIFRDIGSFSGFWWCPRRMASDLILARGRCDFVADIDGVFHGKNYSENCRKRWLDSVPNHLICRIWISKDFVNVSLPIVDAAIQSWQHLTFERSSTVLFIMWNSLIRF